MGKEQGQTQANQAAEVTGSSQETGREGEEEDDDGDDAADAGIDTGTSRQAMGEAWVGYSNEWTVQ